MDRQVTERLTRLRAEFEAGQARSQQLEIEQGFLRERLLMLKGAIGVLEDLLTVEVMGAEEPGAAGDGHAAVAPVTAGNSHAIDRPME
jgi:hypothetical protein